MCAFALLAFAGGLGSDLRPAQAADARQLWEWVREEGLALARELREKASLSRRARPEDGRTTDDDHPDGGRKAEVPPVPRSVAPPRFSRIIIEPRQRTEVEGSGTPGTTIVVSSSGRAAGSAVVPASGSWKVMLDRALGPGDHRIVASASEWRGATAVIGPDVRIAMPEAYSERVVIAYNGDGTEVSNADRSEHRDPARARAEELARAASERFSELVPPPAGTRAAQKEPGSGEGDAGARSSGEAAEGQGSQWLERSAREYQRLIIKKLSQPPSPPPSDARQTGTAPGPAPAGNTGQILPWLEDRALAARERAQDWLAKANRSYRGEIARRLSVPRDGAQPQDVARSAPAETGRNVEPRSAPPAPPATEADRRRADASQTAEARRRQDEQWDRLEKEALEAEAKGNAEVAAKEAEEKRLAEVERRRAEARRLEAEAARRDAEAKRLAEEEKRRAEARRLEQERAQKEAEAKRLAEEARKREEARLLEEEKARKEAEAKRQAETKRIEEERKKEEARRSAEDADKRKAEAKRLAEEAQRKDEERKRLAAESRKEAAQRQKEEAKTRRQAEAERKARERAEQVLEAERLAADVERRTEPDTESAASPMPAADAEMPAPSGKRKISGKRRKDPRPAEGSAEEPAPVEPAADVHEAEPAPVVRARTCRGGKIKRRRGYLLYTVRPGDTLWAIARRFYGKGRRYDIIVRANPVLADAPDLVVACQRLVLPVRHRR
jgi:nucleoid-associated protein YgaU